MKTLFGVLCGVTFAITCVAYFSVNHEPRSKDSKGFPYYSEFAEQDKATKMVAVTSKACPPCRRLKLFTLPVLKEEGYDVTNCDIKEWDGPEVKVLPTLFYYKDDKIIYQETGFRTPRQIKKHLTKE